MKKIILFIAALLSIFMFSSCGKNKNIEIAKDYVDEYYKNFSQKNSTQCFYQLNKNSAESLEHKYSVGAEELFSSRSSILGRVTSYDILSEEYYKENDDKYINFDIMVKYENAEVNEKQQVIIKEDGQISINLLEFADDDVITDFINSYKNTIIMSNTDALLDLISEQYYEAKTERNLESMIEQAGKLGGKLLDCNIIKDNYYFQSLNIGSYVYEALLEMKYENMSMQNKIKITESNGKLGIGYTIILPEQVLSFFEKYTEHLKNKDKENTIMMYNPELFEGDEDKKNSKWEKLLTYFEAYGDLVDYEILSMTTEDIEMPDDSLIESMKVEALMNYERKTVKHKITIIEGTNGDYIIFEQYISDD